MFQDMARRVLPFAACAAVLMLSGCGYIARPERPAWRGQAEKACLAEGRVRPSEYARPANPIEGPGICGLDHPFKVSALAGGTVALHAPQTIGCPLTAALDEWVGAIQPIAMARFGQPIVQIDSMGAYSCRPIDNIHGAHLSEHSFGNAIDIGGFRLADGHSIVVVKAWTRGDPQEQAFLREAQAGACNVFTTVLAPGSDMFHYNHIHLDLAAHGRTSSGPRRYCKPRPSPQLVPAPGPRDALPDAPDIEEDMDVSSRSVPRSTTVAGGLDVAAPPLPPRSTYRQAFVAAAPPAAIAAPPRPAARVGAPMQLNPHGSAHIDADGVFVPEGDPANWDSTSSIPKRR